MIWWVLFASLALLAFRREIATALGALPEQTRRALPPTEFADPGLHVRIVHLLETIDDVFAIEGELTPPMMQASARLGRLPASAQSPGPATRVFSTLYRALDELEDEERRVLADAGLDPSHIRRLLDASTPPDRWRSELLNQLERYRREIRALRPRRYG